ncbi:MAG: AraC-like DNA-binding protein [Polaribacter sp.]|jgi:AraC-like DNA-binding protein
MIFSKKYTFFFILLLIITPSVKAQNNQIDSLSKLSFEVLEKHFKEQSSDSIKKQSAQAFLLKAKREKKSIKIADGYYFLSELNKHNTLGVKYADSILALNINKKGSDYPAKGYLQKGIQLYYLANYSEAFENYLRATEYYKVSKNEYGQLCVKHYIGLLKDQTYDSHEALKIFRKNLLFFNNKEKQIKYQKQYLKSLFALANSYNKGRLLDSAEIFNKKGLLESWKNRNKYLYPYFLMSYGITKKLQNRYDSAIDSLLKSTQLFKKDKTNIAVCNLYLYKSFLGKKQEYKAIEYLKKNDSLFKVHPEIIFQAKDSYELLLKYYKENNKKEKYLKVIEKLLTLDSIIRMKHINLSKKIVTKYEIPLLLSEKERLISELDKSNSFKKTTVFILVIVASLFLLLTFYFFSKNKVNKKKFNDLMWRFDSKKKLFNNKNTELLEITTTELSEELVKDVLNKLLIFEKSNKFIKNDYTLSSLAKELKTNSSYLSKIINSSKKVNFSNYLNKLRIEYAIQKLTTDKTIRNYTVQAIAEDVGFNKAQSFSTAFQKETGISITYFIKQINNNKPTEN